MAKALLNNIGALRKWHRKLAYFAGIQLTIWFFTGLYMTAVPLSAVHGDFLHHSQKTVLSAPTSFQLDTDLELISAELVNVAGIPYWLTTDRLGQRVRRDIDSFSEVDLPSKEQAIATANAIYTGDGELIRAELLSRYPREIGGRDRPVWRIEYAGWLQPTFYLHADTLGLIRARSELWRWFDLFWALHIMDYIDREDVHNPLIKIFSAVTLVMVTLGIFLGLAIATKGFLTKPTTTRRQVHMGLSLVVGWQVWLWLLSGNVFIWLDSQDVSGRNLLVSSQQRTIEPQVYNLSPLWMSFNEITSLRLTAINNRAVVEISSAKNKSTVDAQTFVPIQIDKLMAVSIASERFAGDGEVAQVGFETVKTTENRKFELPLWRVDFSDSADSSMYLSTSGQVQGLVTNSKRVFDWFWMLHTMNWVNRDNFNHPIVIIFSVFSTLLAMTGVMLSAANLKSRRRKKAMVRVQADDTSFNTQVNIGASLFDTIGNGGFELPESCGGGDRCKTCRVVVTGNDNDKVLACRYRIQDDCTVTLTPRFKKS